MDRAVTVSELEITDEMLLQTALSAALGVDVLSLAVVGIGYLGVAGPRSLLVGVGALGFGLGFICAGVAVRRYGEPLALSAIVWLIATVVGATGVAILTDTGPAFLERGFLYVTGLVTALVAVLFVAASFHFLFRKIDL